MQFIRVYNIPIFMCNIYLVDSSLLRYIRCWSRIRSHIQSTSLTWGCSSLLSAENASMWAYHLLSIRHLVRFNNNKKQHIDNLLNIDANKTIDLTSFVSCCYFVLTPIVLRFYVNMLHVSITWVRYGTREKCHLSAHLFCIFNELFSFKDRCNA